MRNAAISHRPRLTCGAVRRALVTCSAVAAAALGCSPAPEARPITHPVASASAEAEAAAPPALGDLSAQHLPTGADITPLAAPGSALLELDPHFPGHPELRVGFATSVALSPNGRTLAVLTAGYNRYWADDGAPIPGALEEHVFLFDVHDPAHVSQDQVLAVPNAFWGITFSPDGAKIVASGGSDDGVWEIDRSPDGWKVVATPIKLGHAKGLGRNQSAIAAGVAFTADGAKLVVANHDNDSLSIVDTSARAPVAEVDLRPGGGAPGGEFPAAVAVVGDKAYVTSQRDREVVEVDLAARRVTRRCAVGGQPTKLIASRDGARLYVADANTDDVAVIDRASLHAIGNIPVGGPPGSLAASLRGASPNGLALSPDGKRLYVTLGGANAVAVVALDEGGGGAFAGAVPTGFYPSDVAVSPDGSHLFVAYGKSMAGPNPKGPWSDGVRVRQKPFLAAGGNQFVLQRMRAGLHSFPVPDAATLALLTAQAMKNEHLDAPPAVPPIFERLRGKIRHVVYVVAENRTFDQLLADVPGLDGDDKLLLWGEKITPNQHALARSFSGFDRFFDSGGVSGDGWQWSTAARTTDAAEKEVPLLYAERGKHSYDWEGKNRGINVSIPTLDERRRNDPRVPDDPDLLPGPADMAAVDRPREGGTGYLWDAAKAAGVSVRNYGFFIDDGRYGLPARDKAAIPPVREPYKTKAVVAYPTAFGLHAETDPYFRGFDMTFPDFWRARELLRELDGFAQKGTLPGLLLVRLPADHLGAFARAVDGVDTPDTQVADHDYALGLVVEALSKTPFWEDTIVIALEDDAQNGADHVDAHRSVLFFAGGHAARGAVVHTTYTTPSALRTIEVLLDLPPLGRRDAVAPPIAEAFSETAELTPFVAKVPDVLRSTKLPLPAPKPPERSAAARGTAASWAKATAGMDFSHEDELPTAEFNSALYCGLAPTLCR